MIFDFQLNGKTYKMDLSPELRVGIARHLIKLHKEYCLANPTENIELDAYLALVEKSPHPENESTAPTKDDDDDDRTELARRKDLMIEVLLEALAKLK